MHGRAHVGRAVGAGQVELVVDVHEKRPFFAVENRITLVGHHLELVAFHLAEVGIDRQFGVHRRGDAVFYPHADLGRIVGSGPFFGRLPVPDAAVGDRRQGFQPQLVVQFFEHHRRQGIEIADLLVDLRP